MVIELWVGSAIVGLLASAWGITEALGDLGALGGDRNGRRLVGRSRLTAHIGRAIVFGVWLALGAERLASDVDVPLTAAVAGLLLTNAILTGIALLDIVVGARLRRSNNGPA